MWAATSAQEWLGIVDLAIEATHGWPADTCLAWVRRLEAFDYDLVPYDESQRTPDWALGLAGFDHALKLLETLLARLSALGVAGALQAFSALLGEATCSPVLIEIPRRYLVAVYPQWLDDDFLPGVGEYHAQFRRKATAQEKVAIAKRAMALDSETAWTMRHVLVADALPHVLHLEPELLPRWLDLLDEAGSQQDPQLVALCGRLRTLCKRLPVGADLPTALRDYLAAGELHRALVADAKAAVDAVPDDVVRLPKQSLGMLLERDMLLLMAQLPAELELVGCDEAKALLRDYRRLRALGASAPLNLCLLLTRAIEAQLHHALTLGHDGDVRRRIEGVGLATLAEFVMGPVDKLAGLAVRPRLEKADWEALNHAGRIRNRVHHEPSRVCGADLDHLQRAIFDVDPRAPRLLKKLATLRCVRMA